MKILLATIKFYHTHMLEFYRRKIFLSFFLSHKRRVEFIQKGDAKNENILDPFLILIHVENYAHTGEEAKKGFISKLNLAYVSNKLKIQGILSPTPYSAPPRSSTSPWCNFSPVFIRFFLRIHSCTFFYSSAIERDSPTRFDTFSFS